MDRKSLKALPGGSRFPIRTLHPRHNHGINLTQLLLSMPLLALAVLLSACSPATNAGTPTPTTVMGQINPAAPTATPAPTSLPQPTASPVSLDPCVLIDSQEASTYAGASFGPGQESTTAGGGKICTYGANTANVFMLEVAQTSDVAMAQAAKADFLAMLQASAGQLASAILVTDLPNIGDGATMGQLSVNVGGIAINGSGIGVLKGTIFFGFSDEVKGGSAPSATAVQAEATSLLGRLP
jgi:hypothetical protein